MLKLMLATSILCAGFAACAGEQPGRLYAGTAKVDITPSAEAAIDLVNRRLRIEDRLEARVLVLKSERTSVAIVTLDLILFSSAGVVAEARQKWGVDHVILSCTHTHSGMAPKGLIIGGGQPDWTRRGDPAVLVDWPGLSSDPWYAETEAKVVAAIGQAMDHLFPARVAVGRAPFKSDYMAHNRRRVHADGRVTMMWTNEQNVPTEPVDPQIRVIRVDDDARKPRALLVHYACHPVGLMNTGILSRDFPGAMVDHIEEKLGPDGMGMFLQGASGDMDPSHIGGEGALERSRRAGVILAEAALRLSNDMTTLPEPGGSLQAAEQMVKLAYRNDRGSTDACVMTVLINRELAMVTIPGEPFIQLQLDLAEKSAAPDTIMLGLAYAGRGNPFLIYVPTEQAVTEGGYGATDCAFLEPEAGERMVNTALARIREMLH
jgi:neutral ceramidase